MSEELCDRQNAERDRQNAEHDRQRSTAHLAHVTEATAVRMEDDRLRDQGERMRMLLTRGYQKFNRGDRELHDVEIDDGELYVSYVLRRHIETDKRVIDAQFVGGELFVLCEP